jgi:hypothetical protein
MPKAKVNSQAKEKFLAFKAQYEEARKKMIEQTDGALKEMVKEIFDAFPGLQSFGWTQYTPYFNDGDTCEFGVNTYSDEIYINDSRDEDDYEDWKCPQCKRSNGYDVAFCPKDGAPKPVAEVATFSKEDREAAAEMVSDMLKNFDDDMMQDLYGDHVQVTIHRNGTATKEEYEHD